MKRTFRWRVGIGVIMSFGIMSGSVSQVLAQGDPAPQSSSDLASRIDSLEKQLADLRTQMEAQKAAAAAPAPAPAPAGAALPAAAPAAAPSPTGLAGLLGPTTLSGFVDVYYGYNSNQPANRTTALRNFDVNSSQFALNMLELVADKAPDATASRVGYHIALGFGQAMNLVNGSEVASPNVPGTPVLTPPSTITNFDQYLKEGYLEYLAPVGKGLQINVGKFVTPAGAEVIETKDNWNYSRGLLFSWAIPYFHFGMSGKYAFNSKFALTGYLVNGWNNSVDNNSGKTTGFSAAWTPNSRFGLTENYLVGPEQADNNGNFRHLTDTVVTYSPTAKLSLMANYDYGHDAVPVVTPGLPTTSAVWWTGFAGYIKYAPNATWAIATRGEWFKDHNGFSTGTAQNVGEFTLTLQRMLASKIIARLEFRRDMSDEDVFPYRTGLLKDAQNTVTLGMVYAFSSADAK
jgi:Putative beta-barrel porin-2, OmpL-like. bbp2